MTPMAPMTRFVLLDIEGTTTDIQFVHKVLFPYSAERLAAFVNQQAQKADVQTALAQVRETVQTEQGLAISDSEAIETLLRWIHEDRKHTALKLLQGLIWKEGFEQGHYQGHVYPDVPQTLERWKNQGIGLAIYSSGSVQAQKLLFAHSVAGDLTPYFSHYFDTNVGGKKESDSYREIARRLDVAPAEILFLSDVEAELDAASEAGLQVTQLLRDGQASGHKYPAVESFEAIPLPPVPLSH